MKKNEKGEPKTINAFVYAGTPGRNLKKPSERYIRVLTIGATQHGITQNYIDSLSRVEYIPSKKPEQYLKLPEPATDKTYTIQEFEQLIKSVDPIQSKTVIYGINKKLVKITFTQENVLKFYSKFHGMKDSVFTTLSALNEPDLPPLESENDITDNHRKYVENLLMEFYANVEVFGYLKY